MKQKPLNLRMRRFVAEYLVDGNAKRAAIAAGYSPRSAEVRGCRLLQVPKVAAAVAEKHEKQLHHLDMTAQDVLRELARVARVDLRTAFDAEGRLLPMQSIPEDTARALAGVEVEEMHPNEPGGSSPGVVRKVKLLDKVRALELLGKHHKLFTDKVEHSGAVSFEQVLLASQAVDE